jgi:hypothetical protein
MKRIIRVFPKKSSFTPIDDLCFFDEPGAIIPEHDEIHVCAVFTWDKERALELQESWQEMTNKPVLVGGPAFDDPCTSEFIPGLYVAPGITFCSRGCPLECPWCFVPKREGRLRETEVKAGNIIQDNNFLGCSLGHRRKVYDMLKTQRKIDFKGGLKTTWLTDWDIEEMRGLHIHELWLACDTKGALNDLKTACERLKRAGFSQNKIRCYVLVGDSMEENQQRLIEVYEAGALPFAQLFQPEDRIKYDQEWERFARTWSRPAITRTFMKEWRMKNGNT